MRLRSKFKASCSFCTLFGACTHAVCKIWGVLPNLQDSVRYERIMRLTDRPASFPSTCERVMQIRLCPSLLEGLEEIN